MKKNKKNISKRLINLWKNFIRLIEDFLNFFMKIINVSWQFFLWFWEEAIAFVQWLLTIIATIIDRFGKFFLWIWGFLLATALVGSIIFWIISIGFKNIDATNSAQKILEKSDKLVEMKVNFVEAIFQYHLKNEFERKKEYCEQKNKESEKEICLKNLDKLFEAFIK